MISLPLLQKILPTIEGGTQEESILTLVIIIVVVVLTITTSLISSKRSGKRKSSSSRKKVSKRAFIKKGLSLGLSKAQAHMLRDLVQIQQLSNPLLVYSSDNILDTVLKKSIVFLEKATVSEELLEERKNTIYKIKQILESKPEKTGLQMTTSRLRAEQDVVIRIKGAGRFKTTIHSNKNNAIHIITPMSKDNKLIKIKVGTLVNILFWKNNGEEYSFVTRVIGYKDIYNVNCTLLQHTSKVTKTQLRRHKRKTVEKPVYFYPVTFINVGIGKKARKQAFINENSGLLGTLNNISAGGCSITSDTPLGLSELVKLQFETDNDTSISCFGKIIRITNNFGINYTMNILFTKVSKKNSNLINSFVYNFEGL